MNATDEGSKLPKHTVKKMLNELCKGCEFNDSEGCTYANKDSWLYIDEGVLHCEKLDRIKNETKMMCDYYKNI